MRVINGLAAAATLAGIFLLPQLASADTVCKEECRAGVCRQVCVETEGRADRREDRREERREERRDDRRDRAPGIELRVPGVEVEIGR
jgi:hypothetical protein